MEGNKPFLIATLLLAAMAAHGAPTVATDGAVMPVVRTVLDTPAVTLPIKEVVGPLNTELANLGAEFLQPPANCVVAGKVQGNHVRSLPGVPAALFMVLFGFVCVSLVKDRKLWLTVLAGLLWTGQTGIQALPQLAVRLGRRNHSRQQFLAEVAYLNHPENSNRPRSDIEGTQYIGLLHHLAGIPNASSIRNPQLSTLDSRLPQVSKIQHLAPSTNTFPSAIISGLYRLNSPLACLVSQTEHFVCFSPAFIFAHLSRGPPLLA